MEYTPSVVASRQNSCVELVPAGTATPFAKTRVSPENTPEMVYVSRAPPEPLFLVTETAY